MNRFSFSEFDFQDFSRFLSPDFFTPFFRFRASLCEDRDVVQIACSYHSRRFAYMRMWCWVWVAVVGVELLSFKRRSVFFFHYFFVYEFQCLSQTLHHFTLSHNEFQVCFGCFFSFSSPRLETWWKQIESELELSASKETFEIFMNNSISTELQLDHRDVDVAIWRCRRQRFCLRPTSPSS